jgi:3-hydroxyisobutyrate dehydrogenase-like beta-hydroxyacid dehydrogenase
MEPVGFIGVGAMGSSIASRLVEPYKLFISDNNPAAADELVESGATFASTNEIAAACRTVFLCLPGPADVGGLMLGPAGLANRLAPGSIVIDTTTSTSTMDAEIAAALRKRGAEFADSPIAGGVRRARAGTAVLMVGAAPEVFAKIQELLLAITPDVIHVGPVGTGHAMKLVNNLLNACNRFAALETVRLGELAGLSQDVIIDVLNKSSGRNYVTEYTFPLLLSGESYKPQGFTLELMRKDIRLANDLAASLGHRMPIGNMVQTFMEDAIARFGGEADQSQMMAEWYKA